jgi:hypothetical protein
MQHVRLASNRGTRPSPHPSVSLVCEVHIRYTLRLANELFIDTVPVTVTYLVSNYKNDYEEEHESAGKEMVRHFPGVVQVFLWRC